MLAPPMPLFALITVFFYRIVIAWQGEESKNEHGSEAKPLCDQDVG